MKTTSNKSKGINANSKLPRPQNSFGKTSTTPPSSSSVFSIHHIPRRRRRNSLQLLHARIALPSHQPSTPLLRHKLQITPPSIAATSHSFTSTIQQSKMAAASHLTILSPKPRTLQTIRATASSSTVNPSPPLIAAFKKRIMGAAAGILAASVVAAAAPLEADATRIEYFATVSEPSCELTFVRSGLGYCDVVVGSGEEVPFATLINVHYTARFADGIVFDSTYKRARPLTMRLGVGKVIKGLDQGILGGGGVPAMHVGGKRKLHIPPRLAYGPEPAGCFSGDCNIPANATLVYDVNFVNVYSGNRKS